MGIFEWDWEWGDSQPGYESQISRTVWWDVEEEGGEGEFGDEGRGILDEGDLEGR